MVMDWERIEPWDYIVVSVAAEYHKKYAMVELDDIKQSLYQWFLEHPRKLNEWEAIGNKDAKNLIYRSLRNQALDYCQRWKAKSIGYEVTDLFYYTPEMIEIMLPSVLRDELNILPVLNLGGAGRPPAPSEGGNVMAMMVEIDNAYNKLSAEDKTVLFYKYAESLDYSAIALEMELGSEDAARMRHNRAIKKLITRIGGFRPFLDKDIMDRPDSPSDESEPVPNAEQEQDETNRTDEN